MILIFVFIHAKMKISLILKGRNAGFGETTDMRVARRKPVRD